MPSPPASALRVHVSRRTLLGCQAGRSCMGGWPRAAASGPFLCLPPHLKGRAGPRRSDPSNVKLHASRLHRPPTTHGSPVEARVPLAPCLTPLAPPFQKPCPRHGRTCHQAVRSRRCRPRQGPSHPNLTFPFDTRISIPVGSGKRRRLACWQTQEVGGVACCCGSCAAAARTVARAPARFYVCYACTPRVQPLAGGFHGTDAPTKAPKGNTISGRTAKRPGPPRSSAPSAGAARARAPAGCGRHCQVQVTRIYRGLAR